MVVMERTQSERTVQITQSERSYTASYGRSVAAIERAMTTMERTLEESAYNWVCNGNWAYNDGNEGVKSVMSMGSSNRSREKVTKWWVTWCGNGSCIMDLAIWYIFKVSIYGAHLYKPRRVVISVELVRQKRAIHASIHWFFLFFLVGFPFKLWRLQRFSTLTLWYHVKNSVRKQIEKRTQKIRMFNGELEYTQYVRETVREKTQNSIQK